MRNKPLQTHGMYTKTWMPTEDRFSSLEASDEPWARPLGFGRIVTELRSLFDVRDEFGNLIGYTRHNPCHSELCLRFMVATDLQRFLKVLGEDKKHEFTHRLRKAAYEREKKIVRRGFRRAAV